MCLGAYAIPVYLVAKFVGVGFVPAYVLWVVVCVIWSSAKVVWSLLKENWGVRDTGPALEIYRKAKPIDPYVAAAMRELDEIDRKVLGVFYEEVYPKAKQSEIPPLRPRPGQVKDCGVDHDGGSCNCMSHKMALDTRNRYLEQKRREEEKKFWTEAALAHSYCLCGCGKKGVAHAHHVDEYVGVNGRGERRVIRTQNGGDQDEQASSTGKSIHQHATD